MKKWFSMNAQGGVGEILIYDMIGRDWWTGEGVTAKDFDAELKALGPVSEIVLRVNSPGGDVFDGVAIHNSLKSHPAKITAHIDGIAASAASLIVMAADKIVMPANAFMLIHEPRGMAWGTADTLMAAAADLERMSTTFANTYAERSGRPVEEVRALMAADRLMDGVEAQALGYADEKTEEVRMAASFDMSRLPREAREKIAAVMSAQESQEATGEDTISGSEGDDPVAGAGEETIEGAGSDSNVVALDAARDGGVAYAQEVLDICLLAGMSDKASGFIKDRKPVAEVRREVLAARAAKDAETAVSGKHGGAASPAPAKAGWDKVIAAHNSRVR